MIKYIALVVIVGLLFAGCATPAQEEITNDTPAQVDDATVDSDSTMPANDTTAEETFVTEDDTSLGDII